MYLTHPYSIMDFVFYNPTHLHHA